METDDRHALLQQVKKMPLLKGNKKYCFAMEMVVRDYELDCESIVNNANYLHYLEHARHTFCSEAGLSFVDMHRCGIDPVVRKIEIEYKTSLRGGDHFICCLRVERKGAKFIFHQDIIKKNGELVVTANVTSVCIKDGKVTRGNELAAVFSKYLK